MFRACLCPPDDSEELLEKNSSDPSVPTVLMLVEIVGATGLLADTADLLPNAHCLVYVGDERVHQTDTLSHDKNPIWTVQTNSLCILSIPDFQDQGRRPSLASSSQEEARGEEQDDASTTSAALSSSYDDEPQKYAVVKVLNGKECLGSVEIPFEHILKCRGDREEFPLVAPESSEGEERKEAEPEQIPPSTQQGMLALRFRPAAQEDVEFVNDAEACRSSSMLVSTAQSLRSSMTASTLEPSHEDEATDINFHTVAKTSLFSSSKKKDGTTGETLVRLQPPKRDPDLPNEPPVEWMTKAQIQQEALEPSWNWVETGHGEAGTLYLEVIGCDNLPNLDLNVAHGDKSDPFVGVCFEDNMMRTRVLKDERSPRWMPWNTRAFAFNISNPGSVLYLGVFDYDEQTNHDGVGNVVINTRNFESGMTHLLHYDLVDTAQTDAPRGTITIRLRIEWDDENSAARLALTAPPPFIINVETKKAWHVLHYCTHGGVNMEKASMTSVNLYLSEISYYWKSYCYFLDVVAGILLWRGRAKLSLLGHSVNIWFPIQSIWLFTSAALAYEKPSVVPSMFFYSLAWIMISMNYFNSRHPYPWYRVKTFESLVVGLLRGSPMSASAIESNADLSSAKSHADALQKRKADRIGALTSAFLSTASKASRIYGGTAVSVATTEDPSWYFLSDQLYYPHMALKYLCKYGRAFRAFIYWKSYGSFSKTINFLLLGTLCLMSPVRLVSSYTGRLFIWTLLGPLMKLVDIFWVHKYYKTNEELLDDIVNDRQGQDYRFLPFFDSIIEHDIFHSMRKAGRIASEDATKLKAMRESVHGTWSEHVHWEDNSRNFSFPLPQSSAKPCCSDDLVSSSKLSWKFKPGNRLEGNMIMRCPGQPRSRAVGMEDVSDSKKEQ